MSTQTKMPGRLRPLIVCLCFAVSGLEAAQVQVTTEKQVPVVRVNVTNQSYDFFHPWSKKPPYSRRALGAVLAGHRVLVTAELVANADFVELERAETGEKVAAEVEVVDYEANLALLKPSSEKFLDGVKPLELRPAVSAGDQLAVWQLESTGALLITNALLTTVEVSRYPVDDMALLTYRLTSSLQYRDGSFTVPVVKEGKLAGILMRYDSRTQNVDVIPAPVIEHFLKDAAGGKYHGFPRAGVLFSGTRDPQLRRYAGLESAQSGGVYVTEVAKGGPSGNGDIQPGDVILELNDKPVDQDGNYQDPQYGKISIIHLISTTNYEGDTLKLKVFRHGKTIPVEIKLNHRPVEDYVVEPYTIDKPPSYYVLGGLVMLQLSRQYLKEWGAEWYKKAPERFVYLDRFQSDLFPDGDRKIVILSQVLPSATTIGYDDLSYLIVTKINGIDIKGIGDVAKAIEHPINGFHKVEFDEHPKVLYLDAKQVEEGNDALMKNYSLSSLKRL